MDGGGPGQPSLLSYPEGKLLARDSVTVRPTTVQYLSLLSLEGTHLMQPVLGNDPPAFWSLLAGFGMHIWSTLSPYVPAMTSDESFLGLRGDGWYVV